VGPSALREVRRIAYRWGEVVGPELPDPSLLADKLSATTAAYLRASCFVISIPFREGWEPEEDPVFANEIVIRVRPWASFHAVIQAYRTARRELLRGGSGFAKIWGAAEKKTRNLGGPPEGDRRSRDPQRDEKIRTVHDLHDHDNASKIHSYLWLARKFQIGVSTAFKYNRIGQQRCRRCPPAK
jgi:hypothetical protein